MKVKERRIQRLNAIIGACYELSRKYKKFLSQDDVNYPRDFFYRRSHTYLELAAELTKIVRSLGGKPKKGPDAMTELVNVWQQTSEMFFGVNMEKQIADSKALEKYIEELIPAALESANMPIHAKIYLNRYLFKLKDTPHPIDVSDLPPITKKKVIA